MPDNNLPSRETALASLFDAWTPRGQTEMIPLCDALGFIAAEDQFSVNTLPVCRASQADGVALCAADWQNGKADTTEWRLGNEFVRADTGDDFPDRYDTILRIEDVDITADGGLVIHAGVPVKAGDTVKLRGADLQEGDLLLKAGSKIRPMDLAVLAMGGVRMLPVRKKPIVAFLPTGSELVMAGIQPGRGQNVDSNSLMVKPMLETLGAEPLMFPIVRDDPQSLEQALDLALARADIVVINGGSSKGEEDFNTRLLAKKGKVLHHCIAAVPGKPMCLAVVENKAVVNLPGPGIAAFHGMCWCVSAIVARFLGVPVHQRPTVKAVMAADMETASGYANLCKLNVTRLPDGTFQASHISFREVRTPVSMGSNAMYISPRGESLVKKGAVIDAELLCSPEML